MKNPDTVTILGARTGRLQRETVDSVHEQIKYFFRLYSVKEMVSLGCCRFPRWPIAWGVEQSCAFIDVSGTFCHPVKNFRDY